MSSSTAIAPFGERYAQSGTTDVNFTGQNQDTLSGVYGFPAREYGATSGRWPSPDPSGLAAVHPGHPQSWSCSADVQNDPLSLTDPLGLDAICSGGTMFCYVGSGGGGGDGDGGWDENENRGRTPRLFRPPDHRESRSSRWECQNPPACRFLAVSQAVEFSVLSLPNCEHHSLQQPFWEMFPWADMPDSPLL